MENFFSHIKTLNNHSGISYTELVKNYGFLDSKEYFAYRLVDKIILDSFENQNEIVCDSSLLRELYGERCKDERLDLYRRMNVEYLLLEALKMEEEKLKYLVK